jgi:hypothetical protein
MEKYGKREIYNRRSTINCLLNNDRGCNTNLLQAQSPSCLPERIGGTFLQVKLENNGSQDQQDGFQYSKVLLSIYRV